jgi:hypothetical protein
MQGGWIAGNSSHRAAIATHSAARAVGPSNPFLTACVRPGVEETRSVSRSDPTYILRSLARLPLSYVNFQQAAVSNEFRSNPRPGERILPRGSNAAVVEDDYSCSSLHTFQILKREIGRRFFEFRSRA